MIALTPITYFFPPSLFVQASRRIDDRPVAPLEQAELVSSEPYSTSLAATTTLMSGMEDISHKQLVEDRLEPEPQAAVAAAEEPVLESSSSAAGIVESTPQHPVVDYAQQPEAEEVPLPEDAYDAKAEDSESLVELATSTSQQGGDPMLVNAQSPGGEEADIVRDSESMAGSLEDQVLSYGDDEGSLAVAATTADDDDAHQIVNVETSISPGDVLGDAPGDVEQLHDGELLFFSEAYDMHVYHTRDIMESTCPRTLLKDFLLTATKLVFHASHSKSSKHRARWLICL